MLQQGVLGAEECVCYIMCLGLRCVCVLEDVLEAGVVCVRLEGVLGPRMRALEDVLQGKESASLRVRCRARSVQA